LFANLVGVWYKLYYVYSGNVSGQIQILTEQIGYIGGIATMAITEVKTEITGSVWKIEVQVGDRVLEDDILLILESMKMEIPMLAPVDGIVTEIKVAEGDVLPEGTVAVILQSEMG
jgi:biotin carboxyl carrier protein